MRYNIMQASGVALEAIAFQDGMFFKELTQAIDSVRATFGNSPKQYRDKAYDLIINVVKKHTNLTITLDEGGPAVMLPTFNKNHVFYTDEDKEMFNGWNHDTNGDMRKIFKKMQTNAFKGEVSIKESKVSGAFADIIVDMYMPVEWFAKDSQYTSAEAAAVMLHETGHAFTTLEFLTRTVRTNQVLSGLTRVMDKSVTLEDKQFIFSKGAELMNMSKDQRDALMNSRDEKTVTCIVLDAAINQSKTELGFSLYDRNSCEQLADQFASRHGAGRELVTALDKLMNSGWVYFNYFMYGIMVVYMVMSMGVYLTPVFIVFFMLVTALATSQTNNIYDNMHARINRVRMEYLDFLKNIKISNEDKVRTLKIIDDIEQIIVKYKDSLSLIEKLAYFLKPSYRNARKFELLEKEIESFSNNNLFASAAKLTLI